MATMRNRSVVRTAVVGGLMVLMAATGVGCAGKRKPVQTGTVSGTVTYRERVALSPDATIYVRLADVTDGNVKSRTIVQHEMKAGQQVPIPFVLTYKQQDIDPTREYAVDVRLSDKGKLSLITPRPAPVLTKGNPDSADIVLQRAGSVGPATPAAASTTPAAE
jgi:putative lipoprotein